MLEDLENSNRGKWFPQYLDYLVHVGWRSLHLNFKMTLWLENLLKNGDNQLTKKQRAFFKRSSGGTGKQTLQAML